MNQADYVTAIQTDLFVLGLHCFMHQILHVHLHGNVEDFCVGTALQYPENQRKAERNQIDINMREVPQNVDFFYQKSSLKRLLQMFNLEKIGVMDIW